jgi:Flp pilus assembly protein TadG
MSAPLRSFSDAPRGVAIVRALGRRITRKVDGNALIEFAFIAPVLVVLIINILDFAALIWD